MVSQGLFATNVSVRRNETKNKEEMKDRLLVHALAKQNNQNKKVSTNKSKTA